METTEDRYGEAGKDPFMVDITAPRHVEVQIEDNIIRINVNGACRFRACRIKTLEIKDYR